MEFFNLISWLDYWKNCNNSISFLLPLHFFFLKKYMHNKYICYDPQKFSWFWYHLSYLREMLITSTFWIFKILVINEVLYNHLYRTDQRCRCLWRMLTKFKFRYKSTQDITQTWPEVYSYNLLWRTVQASLTLRIITNETYSFNLSTNVATFLCYFWFINHQ